MNVRIKFSKYGIAKFLGHLDVVRYFQKAIRRSGLDISYSCGFNPHQLLYFAAPLGLGHTSDGEYMDAEFNRPYPLGEVVARLNAAMGEGFEVTGASALKEWEPNKKKESIMSLTSCTDYMVSIKDIPVGQGGMQKPYADWFFGGEKGIFQAKMQEYCHREEILAEKVTKKERKTVNIKPSIFGFGFAPESIQPDGQAAEGGVLHAETYQNGLRVFFKLSSGSVDNLKPELVMGSFCREYGIPYQEGAVQFHRMETYCGSGPEWVPLCKTGLAGFVKGGAVW